jgi:dihydroorotate dehydrogenase electron transfer subunit
MLQSDAAVAHTGQIGPFRGIRLEAPQVVAGLSAGRFVSAKLSDYLRAPLFPAHLDQEGFDVLVAPDHPAAALHPGTHLNLIGPLGQGYELPDGAPHVLLVADVPHLPTLLPLTRERPGPAERPGTSVALLLAATTAGDLYPIHLLPPSLEVQIATDDGSVGHAGSVLDLLPDMVGWADCICIATDPKLYPEMAEVLREGRLMPPRAVERHCFAQALVVPPMPCGVGACRGCAVSTVRALKLACTDGPVFDLLRLL